MYSLNPSKKRRLCSKSSRQLATALQNNQSLTTLRLKGNPIGESGICEILQERVQIPQKISKTCQKLVPGSFKNLLVFKKNTEISKNTKIIKS